MEYYQNKPGRPFLVVAVAVAAVAALSLVPWGGVSGGFFKDFNLLEDISRVKEMHTEGGEDVDPALVAAQARDSEQGEAERLKIAMAATEAAVAAGAEIPDSLLRPAVATRRGNLVILEDYSLSGNGLRRFMKALEKRAVRPVRIAVIGDSYIEGDIFTQDLRRELQKRYGGRGVGYVTPHNIVSGFRQSIRQSDKGWKDHDLRNDASADCRWLSGQRFTGEPGATATWKTPSPGQVSATGWNTATILFKASSPGTLCTDTGNGTEEHHIAPSEKVQAICLEGEMNSLALTNKSVKHLTVYGIWLNDNSGIALDCMSLRGNSGITHQGISPALARDMARFVDYDLIIVEYGLNALSAKQKDYSYYSRMMGKVLSRLKESYPGADIIMMGAGDRGQKSGSGVRSTPTLPYMVEAQRLTDRQAGVLFWDTREAMGGEDAIVRWREEGRVNADYIHMNFKGGARMASLLMQAIEDAVKNNRTDEN